jgi:hypothetical protein
LKIGYGGRALLVGRSESSTIGEKNNIALRNPVSATRI